MRAGVAEGLANTLAVGMSKDDQPGGTSAGGGQRVGWNRPIIGKTGHDPGQRLGDVRRRHPAAGRRGDDVPAGGGTGGICDGGAGNAYTCGTGNMFGGKTPARTWFGAMKKILEGQEPIPLPPSDPRFERAGRR